MFSHSMRYRPAFTLIELLLVIGIVAVLAGIVIVAINPTHQLGNARDAERRSAVSQLEKSLYQYLIANGDFPVNIPEGSGNAKAICQENGTPDPSCLDFSELTPDYLSALPIDAAQTGAVVTGYTMYQELGRAHAIATHLGKTGVEGGGGGGGGGSEICDNTIDDDDSDTLIDCADTVDCPNSTNCSATGKQCSGGACICPGGQANETTCNDALDNDCDGALNCLDSDCNAQTCSAGNTCQSGSCQPFGGPGLVGYWKFDETSGTSALDSSGNGNTGTHSGGPTISTDVPSTSFSNARSLSFDGVNDTVQIGSSSIHMPSTLTISFWVKANAWPQWATPLGKIVSSSWTNGWGFYSNGSNLYFFVGNYSSNAASILAPSLGQWVHMAGTWDGTTVSIYKDGIAGASASSSVAPTNPPFVIGEAPGGYFANAFLDDVRIYNRVLSPAEIALIASGGG